MCSTGEADAPSMPSPLSSLAACQQQSSEEIFNFPSQCGKELWEEKPLIPGVLIKSAPVECLIDMLVSCQGTEDETDSNFPRVILLMHQWFISSEELLQNLVSRWKSCEEKFECPVKCNHSPSGPECPVKRYRSQILKTIRYWTKTFPIHFDLNSDLSSRLEEFLKSLRNLGYEQEAAILDQENMPSFAWARHLSVYHGPVKFTRKASLIFDHLEASQIAEHITYLEHKSMRRITFQDFRAYAQSSTLQDNPKLERSISLFNGLSQWIQSMVLSKSLPHQRADVIVKFVNVAKKLLRLQNFNSLMAVVGGLSHSALARLSKTMACVPADTNKALHDLSDLLSSTSNFSNYRRALADCKGFKIPILGVHMKDLITLHVALPDTVHKGQVNFRKIVQLSFIFQELWKLQNSTIPLSVNLDLVNTLKVSLEMVYTEDEIYDLSLTREPRAFSSTSKPVLFSEWVLGVGSPADPSTIEKHILAMVEVLFQNYDQDKDGFLSKEEFETIATNFPLMDDFATLDTDSDGYVSIVEMNSYFLKSNSHVLRSAFQHEFNETTYFKPTFCAHCTGLLWGLIKQGYKCKECGINAHKHCKENVVIECRRSCNSPGPLAAVSEKHKGRILRGRQWRKMNKSSQSEGMLSTESDFPDLSPEDLHETEGLAEELRDLLYALSNQALNLPT